ncbi:unnamed protein product [Lepeophtheirus salmonis]|uniref:(salmon louse) hypothetical protein n=1 Tax=Lepeophtheirus salmonis TaxID=72036 RepID=A0A7R8H559_LEPSM|nr:unnamed protein product [Lepeophtheirus salmonis]CAF2870702.1 unnamed protein product [Lepeophtheirus salmonis]
MEKTSSHGNFYNSVIKTTEIDPSFVELFNPPCDCSRIIKRKMIPIEIYDVSRKKLSVNDTTCSFNAFKRGPDQKVIGFTFYEPNPENTNKLNREYFEGISENLRLISKFYPGFVMRLYYQARESDTIKKLCNISCSNSHLDLCDITEIPMLGNSSVLYPLLWRFLPVLDKQVSLFLSRDLDSRISQREVSAVETFLESDEYSFHVMRDHPAHATTIMGGTWAVKVDRHRKEFKSSFKKLFKDTSGLAYINRTLGGYDQVALSKYVWPWAKWRALSHDSYLCKKYPRTSPFPTKRVEGIGNYVGSVVSLNATIGFTSASECPFKCRPRDHKDWIFC